MNTQIGSGFPWAETVRRVSDARSERARVVGSLAEYLAEDLREHPDRATDAMVSLAEWCEDDQELLAEARVDVLRRASAVQESAEETNRGAAELLELVAKAS
jgi:hypothetical protein